jgi:hypothetical protein
MRTWESVECVVRAVGHVESTLRQRDDAPKQVEDVKAMLERFVE